MVAVIDLVVVSVENPVFNRAFRGVIGRKHPFLEPDLDSKVTEPFRSLDIQVGFFVQPPVDEFLHQGLENKQGLRRRLLADILAL